MQSYSQPNATKSENRNRTETRSNDAFGQKSQFSRLTTSREVLVQNIREEGGVVIFIMRGIRSNKELC